MNETLIELAKRAGGLREPGMRGDGMWVFTEPDLNRFIDNLFSTKDAEIEKLKTQISTLSSQCEIYRGALFDSR